MKVIKYKIFNSQQEFTDWQTEEKRELNQVQPIFSGVTGDVESEGKVGLQTEISIFVLYTENNEAKKILNTD